MAGVEKGTAKNNREREPEEGPGGSPRAFTNMDFLGLKEVLCFKNSFYLMTMFWIDPNSQQHAQNDKYKRQQI